jgi:hypothetical protein
VLESRTPESPVMVEELTEPHAEVVRPQVTQGKMK